MVEATRVLRRQTFHRQKAHLVLSAMRHRVAELGERVTYVRSETFRSGLAEVDGLLDVIQPTTFAAARLVADLAAERPIERRPARGFATSRAEFVGWASRRGGRRLLMEDFYRETRRRLGVLVEGGLPVGGRWTFDSKPGEPPMAARPDAGEPWWPAEDAIDAEVRADLDALAAEGVPFAGEDGPRRFAATRAEALTVLADFVTYRLPRFRRSADTVGGEERWMSNSVLTAPLNLGLLHPIEVVRAAEEAYAAGSVSLATVEGFLRQVIGWRDYRWHVYWFSGADCTLGHRRPVRVTRADGPNHHRPRLTVLGSYALQDGWDPTELTSWFDRRYLDAYDGLPMPNSPDGSEAYLRLRSS